MVPVGLHSHTTCLKCSKAICLLFFLVSMVTSTREDDIIVYGVINGGVSPWECCIE